MTRKGRAIRSVVNQGLVGLSVLTVTNAQSSPTYPLASFNEEISVIAPSAPCRILVDSIYTRYKYEEQYGLYQAHRGPGPCSL